jgi:hypothetical protein
MGLPQLTFAYQSAAETVVSRSKKSIVALVLRDAGLTSGVYTVASSADIPSELGADNQAAVKRALIGYTSTPSKVYLAVLGAEGAPVDALELLTPLDYDYIAGPPDMTAEEGKALADAVIERRSGTYIGKLVLSGYAADNEGVINFMAEDIKTKDGTFSAAQYCGRIAGLLAGTAISGSASSATLSEVQSVKKQSKADLDKAVDAGQLVLRDDGRKIRLGRAVNSKVTLASGESAILKKIKSIETIDLIRYFAITTADDEYTGQCANSYSNKMLLVACLVQYLKSLEDQDLLETDSSSAELDLDATRAYLVSEGVDVTDMTDTEILKYGTGSGVFIAMHGKLLDAMEDFKFTFYIDNE